MQAEWLGHLKPLLTNLVMPPTLPLVVCIVGALLIGARRIWVRRLARTALALGLLSQGLLSTQAVSFWLGHQLLDMPPALAPTTASQLPARGYQAIVVLGGGLGTVAPEYAEPQLSAHSLQRARYGAWLGHQSGLPLMFSGGIGWGQGLTTRTEAQAAAQAAQEWQQPFKWQEDQSRDTQQNAQATRRLLAPQGIERIVLVTHAWHMPRAQAHFRAAGFDVLAAPTAPLQPGQGVTRYLPTEHGLQQSRWVLREWLGQRMAGQ